MKILVTGGNGQLGYSLRLASAESPHHFVFTDIEELDITCAEKVEAFFEHTKIDVVINCAAYTAVDLAEDNEVQADILNHKAVAILADACKRHNATLIHISTDYIFSGDAEIPYNEEAVPAPISVYGRTKLAGEHAVISSGCNYIILRTAWLYSQFGRNFAKTMRELTATRSEIRVVADQVGTPTYAGDLAKAITYIINSGQLSKCGIYNYSNEGQCSWHEFALEIAQLSGNSHCKISPCTTADYPTKACRPEYSVLDKRKIKEVFGIEIHQWKESLKQCIAELEK